MVTNGLDGLAKISWWSIWSGGIDQIDQTIKITGKTSPRDMAPRSDVVVVCLIRTCHLPRVVYVILAGVWTFCPFYLDQAKDFATM